MKRTKTQFFIVFFIYKNTINFFKEKNKVKKSKNRVKLTNFFNTIRFRTLR